MLQATSNREKGGRPLIHGQIALLALGANQKSALGSPDQTLSAALAALEAQGIVIRHVSSFFLTPAFPAGSGPDFVNAAAQVEFSGEAKAFLDLLHKIEAEMGRKRKVRWGQRTLDIDLLAVGDQVLPDLETYRRWGALPLDQQAQQAPDQLILPHPRLQDRAFVLVPLAEIAPDWIHPVLQKSVRDLLAALPRADVEAVKRIE